MDTFTLCNLLESFEEDKRHDEASAMLATNACQQVRFMRLARMIAPVIADIRGEIHAREIREQRTPEEARWLDQRLDHALAAYAAQCDEDVNHRVRKGCPSGNGDTAIGGGSLPGCSP